MAPSLDTYIGYLRDFSVVAGVIATLWKGGKALSKVVSVFDDAKNFMTDMRAEISEVKAVAHEGVSNHLVHIEAAVEKLSDSFNGYLIEDAKSQAEILVELRNR